MKSIKVFGMLACILSLGQASTTDPTVSVTTGQLLGSLTSDGVAVFKTIPFAQPPVGDLRSDRLWADVQSKRQQATASQRRLPAT